LEAKVDIRKLQFLNDRIAQVTDALNQVRLSVHGLQQPPFALQQPQIGLQQPQLGFPLPQLAFQPQPGFPQQGLYGPGPFGFQHSPYFGGFQFGGGLPFGPLGVQPGLQSPMGGGFGLQHASSYSPGNGQTGWIGSPSWPSPFGGGLYHSPPELIELRLGEQRATDPNRILQTFPMCLIPVGTTPW
jgi:hypothetical protein